MSEPSFTPSSRGAFSYHWNKSINNNDSCAIRLLHSIKGFMEAFFTTYTISEHEINTTYLNEEKDSLSDHSNSFFYKEYLKFKDINVTIINGNEPKPNTNNKRLLKAKEEAMMEELSEIKQIEFSADEFINCVLNNNFLDSVHYIVTGDIDLSEEYFKKQCINCQNIPMPKYLTVHGNINFRMQDTVRYFPDIFIVIGNLDVSCCFGIKDLSKTKLKVEGSTHFSFCENMKYPPNQIFSGNYISFQGCFSMAKFPDQLELGYIVDLTDCSHEIIQYFHKNQNRLYPNTQCYS